MLQGNNSTPIFFQGPQTFLKANHTLMRSRLNEFHRFIVFWQCEEWLIISSKVNWDMRLSAHLKAEKHLNPLNTPFIFLDVRCPAKSGDPIQPKHIRSSPKRFVTAVHQTLAIYAWAKCYGHCHIVSQPGHFVPSPLVR